MKHPFIALLFIGSSLASSKLKGQEIPNDTSMVRLKEITVNAIGVERDYQSYGGNISIVHKEALQTSDPSNIQESINRIPGVYMHSGTINTNRITIRGIGSRSPFATNKIRAYFGEIPLTNGSGETNIEDIDLAGLSSYEVIKGPNSSIFGSGLGGVILMNATTPSFLEKNEITNDLTVGSFGLVKEQLSFSGSSKSFKIFGSVGHLTSDGYRDNNHVNRTHALLHMETEIGKGKFNLLTYFVDQEAFIPSSLNENDFEQTPTKAAFTWGAAEGFEDYQTLLQGISYSSLLSKSLTLKSSVFLTHQNNYEPRPFNILDERTTGFGTRNRLIFDFGKETTWMIGTELYQDQHSFQTLANLYRDFPGMGSIEGDQLSDLEERRSYMNVFTQIDHEFVPGLIVSAGLNFNKTQYKLDDRFGAPDQSGNYDYDGVVSPRISLNYAMSPHLNTYLSFSHGFSPPTLEETLLPDGAINPNIEPETGLNTEMGLRGFFNRLTFELTLYRMQVRNLLVSRRTADDQFIGINAGETSHQGIELSYYLEIVNNAHVEFSNQGSYSFSDFTFDEFIDRENSFSGNQLTGVPKHVFFNRLQLQIKRWFYLYVDQQYTSAIPVTDDNTVFSDQYYLLNTTIGHTLEIGRWNYDLGLTSRNITDQKYASMLLINATGFGGAAPRYFYPGLPFNWFSRLRVTYTF